MYEILIPIQPSPPHSLSLSLSLSIYLSTYLSIYPSIHLLQQAQNT